ncbi:leucine-rich repeat serine/threonine-protein kinase 1 isoform X2 [Nematostella vectensis]|uniref:leucine-rich repeat serine/threonine-protein kinase 1 isoform X2 n=1 Tax=Nematostella vectensis TaxID=45351 RepID=UPI00207799F5|nr:leucine-rich repeat serine/threonine-protein kinase 1 isoform X2 [Nematostella vectensis]
MAAPVFAYAGELLHQAAIYDQRDFLRSLLQSGVQGDANCKDPSGLTPVHTASVHDSPQCLEELLSKKWKGDPNVTTGELHHFSTPLHLAARNGHLKCLKILVDAGADTEIRSSQGQTAREIAIAEGKYECANFLRTVEVIKRAAREEEVCQEMFAACTTGDLQKVVALLPEVSPTNINKIYQGGCTLLYKAAYGGFFEITKLLLEHGADGSPNTFSGMTPLYGACLKHHADVVWLLAKTMPHHVNTATKMEKMTPLHVAAGEGNAIIIRILLQTPGNGWEPSPCNGIDVNARTSSGMTALHLAASGGSVEVVRLLLENRHKCEPPCKAKSKADINAQSIMGRTALHDSITVGQIEIVRLLLDKGADVNLGYDPDKLMMDDEPKNEISRVVRQLAEDSRLEDKTPLGIACTQGNLEIVAILVSAGAEDVENRCLENAVKAHHHALVHLLLSKGVNADNEHKIPHSRGNHSAEETWKLNSKAVAIIWNAMKLVSVHPQWIVDAAKKLNPQVAAGNVGLHPVLKTITRIDISCNKLTKLPQIIFQLPSLKTLNASDNQISSLPSLYSGGVRVQNSCSSATAPNGKKFMSCDNIADSVITEIEDNDFTYAESSWNCPHLEEIELHHNSLTSLPTCVFELPSLRYLNVSSNDIVTLPFAMWLAPALKIFDLKNNYLKALPIFREKGKKGAGKTSSLPRPKNKLSKSRDALNSQSIPEFDASPKKGSKVDESKSSEGVKQKPGSPEPSKPQHLKVFCHSQLWGKSGTDEIEESEDEEDDQEYNKTFTLQKLDLSNNRITSVPVGMPCLATSLQTLNLSGNNISEVKTLAQFPSSLSSLDLSNNRLSEFLPIATEPPWFGGDCFGISESRRPGISRRTSAESSRNRVRYCKHTRHRLLSQLKRLDLNKNNIKEIGFSRPGARVRSVGDAKSPTGPKNPAWLMTGDLSATQTSTVIYPSLQSLNISGNPIAVLPKDVGLLTKLGSLHINQTEISKLPPEIGLLSDLWDLQYQGLTLQDIEPSVLERRKTKDLVSYLRSILERSKAYPCMKLMFVGVSNIGKTTLLNQLRQEGTGSFQSSPNTGWTERQRRRRGATTVRPKKQDRNISTVGVDVSDWTFPKRSEFFRGDASRPSIKFSTWDFGGQREYYATHQCFLSHRSLYIAMWKLTDGEKGVIDIEPWLLNIQARAPDSPVLIVGTHYDMLTAEERRSDLLPTLQAMIKERYVAMEYGGGVQSPRERGLPKVVNRIEVSGKTGHNVRELRHMIYSVSLDIKERGSRTPLLETPIPASYQHVEEAVIKIREHCYHEDQTPVMRSEFFRNAVQKELKKQNHRLRDYDELQQATKFLHDNGVLLHYDDPLLRDLYFLDPQWLCDMLAHVVTIREVNPHINNGVMKLSDLSHIFRSENFPANLIKQYINLLSKFEVALPWSSEYLLVPSLLPDRQPISNQPIAPGGNPVVTRAMNMTAYTKTRVLRRQYIMSYIPSGFWPRLITRVIADEEVRDVVRCCCQLVMEGEAEESDKEKLAFVAQPDWSCWKTGIELSCFGVKLLRICDLQGLPFYGAPEDAVHPVHYRQEIHDTTCFSTVEVIAPSVSILMEKFVQKRRVSKRRGGKQFTRQHDDDDESLLESRSFVGFRVKTVTDSGVQLAARLIAIVVEHMDTLITDWFPGLDALTVHGYRLVTRLIPCPKCITALSESGSADQDTEGTGGVPITPQGDSGANLTTDTSSTGGSPWPSPIHVAVRRDIRLDNSPLLRKKSGSIASQDSLNSENPDSSSGAPLSPALIVQDLSTPDRFTYKSASSGLGTNDSSSYFEDTSEQSTDSHEDHDSESSTGPKDAKKGKARRQFFGSTDSEGSREGSRGSDASVEVRAGSQTDSQRSRGSTDSSSSFRRGGRYGSLRRRPTEHDKVIYAFEFDECVMCAYNTESMACKEHGEMDLREITPDVMFEDIAPHLAIHSGNITRGRFLGKGTFGSVFRGELRDASGESISIAMKMPLNNEIGDDAKPEERQAAEAAKRALRDNPTMALNDAYRTIRQEISILLPLRHQNIVALEGFCLSPLCLVLEFAPLGALDRVLVNYKRAGVRLNPYVMQKCIVQCASALKYLHKHHIIYRDLKSENILVWTFPQPHAPEQNRHDVLIKVADYGISRSAALAGIKGLGGTPGFMAPEIEKYVGKECYTDKVDSFSFGMYIYELIALHQPFCDLNPAQVKQMIVDGLRPPLTPKDRKAPVFAMDLMAWCWEQDSEKRPTSAQVYALAASPEFSRLADVITFDKQLTINCAVTAGSRVSAGCGADGRPSVGNEVWVCRKELNAGIGTGKINVMSYNGGRCTHKEELTVGKSCIHVACSVGSTVWLGTESGTLHVYCAITYRELCKGVVKCAKYILSMTHVPRCNWVLVALADGSLLAYNDNICNHYYYKDDSMTPTQELLPSRGYPGNGNPIHCIASLPIMYPRIKESTNEPSSSLADEYICEVWCGQEKGEITVLDGDELQKITTMPAEDNDSDVTLLREQSVSHLETARTFRSGFSSDDPIARSVWVTLYPGTRVFRWDAQEKRVVRSVDCSLYKPRFEVLTGKLTRARYLVQKP